MRGQLLPEQHLLGIAEEVASFLWTEAINDKGEFSVNMPDDHHPVD